MTTTDDRAAKKAEELFDAWVKSNLNVYTIKAAVAAELRKAYAEIEVLNKRIATEYVRGREHEQRARDTVHVPHIEQLKAEIAHLHAKLAKVKP